MAKITSKDQSGLVTSMVKQLLSDRELAVKNNQAGAAVQASRAIAALLGLQLDGGENSAPITVTIDKDLAKVCGYDDDTAGTPVATIAEPTPEDRELADRLLALLNAKP